MHCIEEAFRAHYILDGKGPDTFNHFVAIAVEDKGRSKNTSGNNAKGKDNRKFGRVFYTQVDVTPEGNLVLMGTFLVAHHPAKILFDIGASHTFLTGVSGLYITWILTENEILNYYKIAFAHHQY
ncbi:hypothetical protein ACJX0J_016745 [Zea mays]